MPTIIADNREKNSGVPLLLTNNDIDVKMEQLFVGDYMIDEDIVIERKTNTDFVLSIINGHLFDQCARLRKTGKLPLIIVEGNPFKTSHNIKPEAIKGALLAVNLSWQIPIIRSSGKEDTARLIIMASKQQRNPPVFIRRKGKKPKNIRSHPSYFIQGLPGVGPALAQKLLEHFKSIEKIVAANISSLRKVEGIGKTKADQLYEFIRRGR
ncbi:MAG: hypothetical protein H8E34_05320 [Bacteroidetes bacterium]|nr:hypothetical protein [Bacteroidota bacterium]MBL6943364.1 hypothetical protein [Bacteroidales bacterium]